MLLNEFFGLSNKFEEEGKKPAKKEKDPEQNKSLGSDILEYIINNDRLHKTDFFTIAEKIVIEATKEHKSDVWMPLVNKGCMEFYRMTEMKENPKEIFPEKFRKELCDRLAEHYQNDILKGVYDLGK
jgi:hypothetical protein